MTRSVATHPMPVPTSTARDSLSVRLDTSHLFSGQREVCIVHRGQEYRLRITRQQKLILTK